MALPRIPTINTSFANRPPEEISKQPQASVIVVGTPRLSDSGLDVLRDYAKSVAPELCTMVNQQDLIESIREAALHTLGVEVYAISLDSSQNKWGVVVRMGVPLMAMQFDTVIDNWAECYSPNSQIIGSYHSRAIIPNNYGQIRPEMGYYLIMGHQMDGDEDVSRPTYTFIPTNFILGVRTLST